MNWNDIFRYEEGMLYWKIRPCPRVSIGDRAGRLTSGGYLQVGYKGKYYMVHNVIWSMHFGELPEDTRIDHIDCLKTNNKIKNFRLATRIQNAYNRGASANNTTGLKGVRLDKGKWRAQIMIDGISKFLGYFKTPEEAQIAYSTAAIAVHGEFYRE